MAVASHFYKKSQTSPPEFDLQSDELTIQAADNFELSHKILQ